MPNVETLYQESVRPLPLRDQIRLAELILERAAGESRKPGKKGSALKILEGLKIERPARSSAEIDEYMKSERDSWNN